MIFFTNHWNLLLTKDQSRRKGCKKEVTFWIEKRKEIRWRVCNLLTFVLQWLRGENLQERKFHGTWCQLECVSVCEKQTRKIVQDRHHHEFILNKFPLSLFDGNFYSTQSHFLLFIIKSAIHEYFVSTIISVFLCWFFSSKYS